MGDATVNGDMPHSATLSHIASYPVISDSIDMFTSNPYGAKSIDLTNATYAKFVKPTFPYLQTPASYVKPYVSKADQIGDSILSAVDERIPAVKTETEDIKGTILDYANWPLKQVGGTKDYLTTKYSDEYKKCGGDGYVAGGKAIITSSLVISSDVLNWLSEFLSTKKAEGQEKLTEAKGIMKEKYSEAMYTAEKKGSELKSAVMEKTDEAKEKASK